LKYLHDNFNFNDRVRSAKVFQEKKTQQITYLFDNIPQSIFSYTEEPEDFSSEGAVGGIDEKISDPSVDDNLQANIQYLQELFPDQNELFFKECLSYYKNDADSVVNALLENQIPVEVKKAISKKQYEQSELGQRRNIFDGDQFDLRNLSSQVSSQIHKGKKDKIVDLDQNVPRARKDSLVAYDNEYEDEYDDTYDTHGYDVEFSDEKEHEFVVRPINEKLDIKKRDKFEVEEEETPESSSTEMRRPSFAQQPLPQRQKRPPGAGEPRFREDKQESGAPRGSQDSQRPYGGQQKYDRNSQQPREQEDPAKAQQQQQQKTDHAYKKKTTHNPHNRRNLALRKQNPGFSRQNE